MFYIVVFDFSGGYCYIDNRGLPTKDIESAMPFNSRSEAGQYINNTWKGWGKMARSFRIKEKEIGR